MKAVFKIRSLMKLALASMLSASFPGTFAADAAPPYSTDITLSDIMASIVMPAADVLWKAVSEDASATGTVVTAPQTDEDWTNVRNSAVALAAATNLLLLPQLEIANAAQAAEQPPPGELVPAEIADLRKSNMPAWTAHALLLHDTALKAIKVIDAHDVAGLSNVGGDIDAACESCHLQFWYPNG